jgi:hypothetical protein
MGDEIGVQTRENGAPGPAEAGREPESPGTEGGETEPEDGQPGDPVERATPEAPGPSWDGAEEIAKAKRQPPPQTVDPTETIDEQQGTIAGIVANMTPLIQVGVLCEILNVNFKALRRLRERERMARFTHRDVAVGDKLRDYVAEVLARRGDRFGVTDIRKLPQAQKPAARKT